MKNARERITRGQCIEVAKRPPKSRDQQTTDRRNKQAGGERTSQRGIYEKRTRGKINALRPYSKYQFSMTDLHCRLRLHGTSVRILYHSYRIVFTASSIPFSWMRSRSFFTSSASPGTVLFRSSCQM